MALDDASQHVISALGALQAHSDRQSQATANEWLSTFQHSVRSTLVSLSWVSFFIPPPRASVPSGSQSRAFAMAACAI